MPGGHQEFLDGPQTWTMSELYSHLFEEAELRLAESAQVGVDSIFLLIMHQTAPKDLCNQHVQVNM
jgi:hypothetical protein